MGKFRDKDETPAQTGDYSEMGATVIGRGYHFDDDLTRSTDFIIVFPQEIYKTETGFGNNIRFKRNGKTEYDLYRDYLGYEIFENKIYVADSNKGLYVAVFDLSGKKLYEFNKEYNKQLVTDEYKKRAIAEFKKKSIWEKNQARLELKLPEFLPAIRTFSVNKGKIFLVTHVIEGYQNALIITDLQGNIVAIEKVPQEDYAAIYDNIYYYLFKNENREWELHKTVLMRKHEK